MEKEGVELAFPKRINNKIVWEKRVIKNTRLANYQMSLSPDKRNPSFRSAVLAEEAPLSRMEADKEKADLMAQIKAQNEELERLKALQTKPQKTEDVNTDNGKPENVKKTNGGLTV
jgi:hypothetical protein